MIWLWEIFVLYDSMYIGTAQNYTGIRCNSFHYDIAIVSLKLIPPIEQGYKSK